MTDVEKDVIKSRAINTLKKIPLFTGLLGDEYREVLAICRVCRFAPDEVIFEAGDASFQMYVLLAGCVAIRGRSGNVLTLMPGEILGEIGLVCNVKRTAAATAMEEVTLLEVSKDDFDLLQGRFPRMSAVIMKNIATTLAQRLLKATGQETEFIL